MRIDAIRVLAFERVRFFGFFSTDCVIVTVISDGATRFFAITARKSCVGVFMLVFAWMVLPGVIGNALSLIGVQETRLVISGSTSRSVTSTIDTGGNEFSISFSGDEFNKLHSAFRTKISLSFSLSFSHSPFSLCSIALAVGLTAALSLSEPNNSLIFSAIFLLFFTIFPFITLFSTEEGPCRKLEIELK